MHLLLIEDIQLLVFNHAHSYNRVLTKLFNHLNMAHRIS